MLRLFVSSPRGINSGVLPIQIQNTKPLCEVYQCLSYKQQTQWWFPTYIPCYLTSYFICEQSGQVHHSKSTPIWCEREESQITLAFDIHVYIKRPSIVLYQIEVDLMSKGKSQIILISFAIRRPSVCENDVKFFCNI